MKKKCLGFFKYGLVTELLRETCKGGLILSILAAYVPGNLKWAWFVPIGNSSSAVEKKYFEIIDYCYIKKDQLWCRKTGKLISRWTHFPLNPHTSEVIWKKQYWIFCTKLHLASNPDDPYQQQPKLEINDYFLFVLTH